MTDTFDTLIDNVVESAKECENEHEHRGFYTDSIEKNHAVARTALREAIDEVVKENADLKAYADKLAAGLPEGMLPKDVENIRNANWKLAESLEKEKQNSNRLAQSYISIDQRKDNPFKCIHCGYEWSQKGEKYEIHHPNCAIVLHRASFVNGDGE